MATKSSANSAPQVPCPTCGQLCEYSSKNKSRPFCSRRCKVLDLGAWASDQYRVAGSKDDSATDQSSGDLN